MTAFLGNSSTLTDSSTQWTFLTNHSHVLLSIWRRPASKVREISQVVGITERAVMRIIGELSDAGFLNIEKAGRENRYTVVTDLPLRHPLEKDHTVGELLQALAGSESRVTR